MNNEEKAQIALGLKVQCEGCGRIMYPEPLHIQLCSDCTWTAEMHEAEREYQRKLEEDALND